MSDLPRFWRNKEAYLTLTGQICSHCDSPLFPKKAVCPHCGGEPHGEINIACRRGEVYSYTVMQDANSNPPEEISNPSSMKASMSSK